MDALIIGISGAIALFVIGLEGFRGWRNWDFHRQGSLHWRGLVGGLVLTGLAALGLVFVATAAAWIAVGVGAVLGALLVVVSPLGRMAQALAVLAACGGMASLPTDVDLILPRVAALGLGLGLTTVPALLVMPPQPGLNLLQGVSQAWILVAAITWGSRLADLSDAEPTGWTRLLPLGLAALGLIAGSVPLLVSEDSAATPAASVSRPWQAWAGRMVGVVVAALLGLMLIQNQLLQDNFYTLCFSAGLIGSLLLGGLESSAMLPQSSQALAASGSQLVWRGVLGLILVGGGALLSLRLGGSYGAAVIGLGLLAFPARWGATAAVFLAVRPLVQSLLYEFDLNLSGINITHSYTYAALYLGIAGLAVALTVSWVYATSHPVITAVGLTLASVAGSALIGYFIHLEPQAAFLLGSIMVALVIATLDPVWRSRWDTVPTWLGTQGLLLTALTTLTALVTTELTAAGNVASRQERALVFLGATLILAVIIAGIALWHRRTGRPLVASE